MHLYCGPTFLAFMRLQYLGRKPKMRFALGCVPYAEPRFRGLLMPHAMREKTEERVQKEERVPLVAPVGSPKSQRGSRGLYPNIPTTRSSRAERRYDL